MEKVLVTGATGFVGGELARRLVAQGFQIKGTGRRRAPELEELGIEMHYGDLATDVLSEDLFDGCELVYHVAAKAGIWGRRSDFYEANVRATERVLKGAQEAGVRRFIFTSTPSVTFNGRAIQNGDENLPLTRSRISEYAWTKSLAEALVLRENGKDGMRTVALRPHLIVGGGDNHLLPTILDRAAKGKLKQVGNGRNRVDITHVDDVVEAHLRAAEALRGGLKGGGAYFINGGNPVELWPWLNRVCAEAGVTEIRRKVPFVLAYPVGWVCEIIWKALGWTHNPPMTRFAASELAKDHYFSSAKAARELGYLPKADPWTGVEDFLARWKQR
ncbi:MAG: NAD-dependent epimerase/dehydratase family protein [Puniceicoccaceae bacterium]